MESVEIVCLRSRTRNLGESRRIRRDWISGPTLELADRMQRARVEGSAEHRSLRRQVARATRHDRNAHWRQVAEGPKRAAAVGDTRKLY